VHEGDEMTDELEVQIRGWFCNSGNEVDKDELVDVLLQLLERIRVLEEEEK
jgi:hypothetical protein